MVLWDQRQRRLSVSLATFSVSPEVQRNDPFLLLRGASTWNTGSSTGQIQPHWEAYKGVGSISPVWECWGLFSLERGGLGGISSVYVGTWKGAKDMEPDAIQWCTGTGPKAVGTNWSTRGFPEHQEVLSVSQWWWSAVKDCLETSSSEIINSLNMVLGNQLEGEGGWMRWPSEVSSNLNHSVIIKVHFAVS